MVHKLKAGIAVRYSTTDRVLVFCAFKALQISDIIQTGCQFLEEERCKIVDSLMHKSLYNSLTVA